MSRNPPPWHEMDPAKRNQKEIAKPEILDISDFSDFFDFSGIWDLRIWDLRIWNLKFRI